MDLPAASSLESAWESDRGSMGSVRLQAGDFATLAEGGAVLHRVDNEQGAFATAAVWVGAPIDLAWVAIQDAIHRPLSHGATIQWLPGATPTTRDVYVRLDLPWPVSDRQWVSRYVADQAVYQATSGRVWRRTWTLGDPGLAPNGDPSAVWVDENTGSWTMLSVDGGTLCVLSARSVIGGNIPNEIAQSWAASGLRRVLTTLASVAATEAGHYTGDHAPFHRPDGTVIPLR